MKPYIKCLLFFVGCLAVALICVIVFIQYTKYNNPDGYIKNIPAENTATVTKNTQTKAIYDKRLERSVTIDGVKRTYIVRTPKTNQSTTPHPVLFAFHPAGAPASFMEENAPFYADPKAASFFVVYPQGYERTFNVGGCCAGAMKKGVDDVAFFKAIMEDLKTLLPIQEKAYLTGFSNGSFMTFRLICDVPERIAAAAPYAGAIAMDSCVTGSTVPVMYVNGSEDSTTLFVDKTNASSRFTNAMNVLVLPHTALKAVATRNGCKATVAKSESISAWGATCEKYEGCPLNGQVSMCIIPNLGHAWPGSGDVQNSKGFNTDGLGPFQPDLDSTGPILDFFLKSAKAKLAR